MELAGYIGIIGQSNLLRRLKQAEYDIIGSIRGDIFSIQAAYRWTCRWVYENGSLPTYCELPVRLRCKEACRYTSNGMALHTRRAQPCDKYAFRNMMEAVENAIQSMAYPSIKPARLVKHEDHEKERARRVEIYARQWNRIEKHFGEKVDERSFLGAAARAVWIIEPIAFIPSPNPDLGLFDGLVTEQQIACTNRTETKTFQSVSEAARYVSEKTGRSISQGQIRSAIKRKHRIDGMRFGYCDWTPEVIPNANGRSSPVKCVTLDLEFDNQRQAAEHCKVSYPTLNRAMRLGHGTVGNLQFVFLPPSNKGERKRSSIPISSLFIQPTTQYAMAG